MNELLPSMILVGASLVVTTVLGTLVWCWLKLSPSYRKRYRRWWIGLSQQPVSHQTQPDHCKGSTIRKIIPAWLTGDITEAMYSQIRNRNSINLNGFLTWPYPIKDWAPDECCPRDPIHYGTLRIPTAQYTEHHWRGRAGGGCLQSPITAREDRLCHVNSAGSDSISIACCHR